MSVKLLTKQCSEFLSLKGGCKGSSKSTLVKIPHCWKSLVTAQLFYLIFLVVVYRSIMSPSVRGPVINQKYACLINLINFQVMHAFELEMLHSQCKPLPCLTACQFMMSSCHILNEVIFTYHVVRNKK